MRIAGYTLSRRAAGNLLAVALILSMLLISLWIHTRAPWSAADPWYRAPPEDFNWTERRVWSGIYEVPDARLRQAQRLLESQSVVELQPKEALLYAGRIVRPPRGYKPYLIRGLGLDRRGQYSIVMSGKAAVVVCETLAAPPSPMQKRPLVAFLPSKPEKVYVTLNSAR